MILQVKNLNFSYSNQKILENISFAVKKGEIISVLGPNGVGKSTLVKCLAQIYKEQQANVFYKQKSLLEYKPKLLAQEIAYVPQNLEINFPLTVKEFVLLGRKPYIKWNISQEDNQIAAEIMAKLSIENLSKRNLQNLSGGEKQKVSLARALAQKPELIILDEPTSNLDLNHQLELIKILNSLANKKDLTVIVVLHDLNLALNYTDKCLLLNQKKVYAYGKAEEVLTSENIKEVYQVESEIIKKNKKIYILTI